MIRYGLPYPPTTNGLFFNAASGRVKTRAYKSWIEEASYAILQQGRKKLRGSVTVCVAVVRPDKRRRDLDNILKPILDLLVRMAVIEDDSMVERISIQWATSGEPCTVLVQSAEMGMAA